MPGHILVTGGTGFLGSYILRELVEKNYSVRALLHRTPPPNWIPDEILQKIEWIEGDILDVVSLQEAMQDIDTVIHSAAIVSFTKRDRKKMYQVNVSGTENVVNMALEMGVRRMVYISSVAALGRTWDGGHVNEEKKWEESKINTHYSKSKHKAEMHVWRGMAEGLDAVILNPSTILGFGDWQSGSCAIFKNVFEEFSWYPPGINGFVDVGDVARVTVLMMESGISEQRFIINGATWSFKKLQEFIADAFGKKRPSRKTTPLLLELAWRLEHLKSLITQKNPLLTKESARVAKSKTWFENDKILGALPGFQFTSLEKSIQSACIQYQSSVVK